MVHHRLERDRLGGGRFRPGPARASGRAAAGSSSLQPWSGPAGGAWAARSGRAARRSAARRTTARRGVPSSPTGETLAPAGPPCSAACAARPAARRAAARRTGGACRERDRPGKLHAHATLRRSPPCCW